MLTELEQKVSNAEWKDGYHTAEIDISTDLEQAYLESGIEGVLQRAVELMNSLYYEGEGPYSYQVPLTIVSLRK